MPHRVAWEPDLAVGHALIDAQHQGLLAQCNRLADLCGDATDGPGRTAFDQAFDQIKALAREHLRTESSLLAGCGDDVLDALRAEFEEFEYLAADIATGTHFDPPELQRFIALWCLGHMRGTVEGQRAHLRAAPG